MLKALYDYDIYPKVVLAGKGTEIHIKPMTRFLRFTEDKAYTLTILPTTESVEGTDREYPSLQVKPRNGELSFFWAFEKEQEYFIRFERDDFERLPWVPKVEKTQLSVYAVEEDLFVRRPYRCDFHVHTTRSDGKEDPAFVAGMYRQHGFDVMAITDHYTWAPSQEAIDAFAGVDIDLKLFHGEEVHLPGNPIHIINFGGRDSVNELCHQDEAAYRAQVEAIMAGLPALPEGVDRFQYAACLWTIERIRQGGGLAVFCHPHWLANVYHVPDAMTRAVLRDGIFDAFEVVSGQSLRENMMQYAMYNDLRAEGVNIPIVGSSDSHGVIDGHEFDYMKTVALTNGETMADIRRAVIDGYTVAMDSYPGQETRMQGTYRMISYVRFLMENYFPYHDELCYEEGRLMRAHQSGDPEAAEQLSRLSGRTRRLMEHYFA